MYTLLILFFLVSIIASFLCSVLEAVLLSISPAYAKQLTTDNPPVGQAITEFQQNIDKPLAAILTLNTIAHTVGAIGVGAQAAGIWGESILTSMVVPVVMTLAVLILSEIIPKTLGAVYWRELAGFTARTLKVIIFLLSPLVLVCQLITKRLIGEKRKSVFTRADFSAMAEIGEKEGVLDQRESTLLQNFMMFKSVSAKDVMTPRTVIISAPESQTLAEFHHQHPDLRFSRIPIYANSIDEITGYIMRDDLLAKLVEDIDHEPLSSLRRDLKTVSEDFPIPELFSHFMSEHSHITMVVDDFGGFAGIVTMEDVIETLLGMEIVDEVDGEVDMQVLARKQWERRASKMGLINTAE